MSGAAAVVLRAHGGPLRLEPIRVPRYATTRFWCASMEWASATPT